MWVIAILCAIVIAVAIIAMIVSTESTDKEKIRTLKHEVGELSEQISYLEEENVSLENEVEALEAIIEKYQMEKAIRPEWNHNDANMYNTNPKVHEVLE